MRKRLNPICRCAYNSPVSGSVWDSLAWTFWGLPSRFYRTTGSIWRAIRLTLISSRCYSTGGCGWCPNDPQLEDLPDAPIY